MAVHALGQLIEDTMAIHSPPLSMREVARRAGLTPSHISRLVSNPIKVLPDPATLKKLARALQLPLTVVVDAGLQSIGLSRTRTEDPEISIIRASVDELPKTEQERLIKQFKAMVEIARAES